MKSKKSIIEAGVSTLQLEAQAILGLINNINDDFVKVVNLIIESKGRVIVTGIGKSAIIAQKIVATFNSTGTPAIFMHAADAIHGDLGMIQKDDIVICISKSGNTPEIKVLAPLLKQSGNTMIGMIGQLNSELAMQADLVLNTYVEKEACPHNLAPTTSTTAQLAMGDALAICLLHARDFNEQDFARYHPGGSLGKKLYLKTGDLALKNQKPSICADASVKDVIIEISQNRLGAVVVVDGNDILGIITDGDIRRMLEKYSDLTNIKASDLMNPNPKRIEKDLLALNALEIIKENNITQLLVTDAGSYFGIVHLHDLLQEGII
ncbi:KpsF/GutQ family sugar-phosphate isomerase [Pedobacter heparinus]|uniref:KpsF/GutQ family protein n=1 Tax=Pedobacter heparinus (strain ATCC 13125 / DSM 2366 / CIP 104194 / JCM 7457 / NBRC 12017 / NCIMB 9290 / NRRL B-14731 / HIM 762-3) TaxID=485917 RepID=C6XWX4_PEDHD|nr:KpsF/GutQ family sugar-phosphate isomerase [Pedobacter heparinus]ACU04268.1 KpsF/GutQ family protein [Pedobacter heparinus DSM 2366]